ncbi:alpha/beta fold hydrolase [Scytonema sp. NUACC26]|uniref:alpha/beta fold hydrolase n=1 Tax=Scytonema sp. NUACC26 TaxID=3140176 RepID=UPI0034DC154F
MPSKQIQMGHLNFHVLEEGNGLPVLLLHGFPDSSYLWRHQIPALAKEGMHVIAPDLRGFGESDKPAEPESYKLQLIVEDVIGILDQLGIERTHVVGHDWGSAVSWTLAALYPERVDRLVALSVGHPATFFKTGMEQREKSWYMLLFQFREIAEELLTREDWKLFRDLFNHHPEISKWLKDLQRPGALTAALNWYRANVAPEQWLQEKGLLPNVQASVLGVWSSRDAYLTEAQMLLSAQHVSGAWNYERIEGASHWMQLDQPEKVNSLLLNFLLS